MSARIRTARARAARSVRLDGAHPGANGQESSEDRPVSDHTPGCSDGTDGRSESEHDQPEAETSLERQGGRSMVQGSGDALERRRGLGEPTGRDPSRGVEGHGACVLAAPGDRVGSLRRARGADRELAACRGRRLGRPDHRSLPRWPIGHRPPEMDDAVGGSMRAPVDELAGDPVGAQSAPSTAAAGGSRRRAPAEPAGAPGPQLRRPGPRRGWAAGGSRRRALALSSVLPVKDQVDAGQARCLPARCSRGHSKLGGASRGRR